MGSAVIVGAHMWLKMGGNHVYACAELPSAGEGDLCIVPEDCLSSGEARGQPERLPQLLLPLFTLQHQTQVRPQQIGSDNTPRQTFTKDFTAFKAFLQGYLEKKNSSKLNFISRSCVPSNLKNLKICSAVYFDSIYSIKNIQ